MCRHYDASPLPPCSFVRSPFCTPSELTPTVSSTRLYRPLKLTVTKRVLWISLWRLFLQLFLPTSLSEFCQMVSSLSFSLFVVSNPPICLNRLVSALFSLPFPFHRKREDTEGKKIAKERCGDRSWKSREHELLRICRPCCSPLSLSLSSIRPRGYILHERYEDSRRTARLHPAYGAWTEGRSRKIITVLSRVIFSDELLYRPLLILRPATTFSGIAALRPPLSEGNEERLDEIQHRRYISFDTRIYTIG